MLGRKLEADYEDNLQRVQEQVPPDQQVRAVFEEFSQALQDRLQRP